MTVEDASWRAAVRMVSCRPAGARCASRRSSRTAATSVPAGLRGPAVRGFPQSAEKRYTYTERMVSRHVDWWTR